MDQQVNNLSDSIKAIFDNSEIYFKITYENDVDRIGGHSFMIYKGPTRCVFELKVKQRQVSFISGKRSWDEGLFTQLVAPYGAFISRNQHFNSQSSDIMIDYTYHINDMDGFIGATLKYAEELYNKQFTQALEQKLSED